MEARETVKSRFGVADALGPVVAERERVNERRGAPRGEVKFNTSDCVAGA